MPGRAPAVALPVALRGQPLELVTQLVEAVEDPTLRSPQLACYVPLGVPEPALLPPSRMRRQLQPGCG
jgi:hypothetical protein